MPIWSFCEERKSLCAQIIVEVFPVRVAVHCGDSNRTQMRQLYDCWMLSPEYKMQQDVGHQTKLIKCHNYAWKCNSWNMGEMTVMESFKAHAVCRNWYRLRLLSLLETKHSHIWMTTSLDGLILGLSCVMIGTTSENRYPINLRNQWMNTAIKQVQQEKPICLLLPCIIFQHKIAEFDKNMAQHYKFQSSMTWICMSSDNSPISDCVLM